MSSSVRKANTPSLSSPAIGGIHAELPVASSSVSYGVTVPSCAVTVFATGSTSVTRRRRAGWMPLRWYQSSGLSAMSSDAFSPASTDESRMRL